MGEYIVFALPITGQRRISLFRCTRRQAFGRAEALAGARALEERPRRQRQRPAGLNRAAAERPVVAREAEGQLGAARRKEAEVVRRNSHTN